MFLFAAKLRSGVLLKYLKNIFMFFGPQIANPENFVEFRSVFMVNQCFEPKDL
jgi:hypothetical protein